MSNQVTIALVGGVGFTVATAASYLHLRHRMGWARPVLHGAALAAIAAGLGFLGGAVARVGLVEAVQDNFSAAVLMGILVGTVGYAAYLSRSLRGLDGFLFAIAAVFSFRVWALADAHSANSADRPWFISHALAFAVSGTCFVAGGIAGVGYLLVTRMLRRKRAVGLVGRVASLESLERFGRWMPVIGFPLFTYGILTGLCGVAHRPDLSRGPWYLDLTFLFSMIAWLVYAYLSVGSLIRSGIRGRRAAVLSTYGLGLIVVAFLVREFVSPLHQ